MLETTLNGDELLAASILSQRPARPRDTALESRALDALIARINGKPDCALQSLTKTMVDLCGAGSASVRLLEGDYFVWPAIAGAWAQYVHQGLPRAASPCGVVVERNAALLFDHPKRIFPNIDAEPKLRKSFWCPF